MKPINPGSNALPRVKRMMLTAEPVRLLEPTGGSTAAAKLIPYTAALHREFQRGIAPWVVHTFVRDLALWGGQAYWSVTPVTARGRRSTGDIPIGFEEESAYFGRVQSRLITAVMAVPSAVKLISDLASFRYVTLLFLLRSRTLALVSVWNPTFFMLLLDGLEPWGARLADDIAAGTLTPPAPLDADLHAVLLRQNRADPARGREVSAILGRESDPAQRNAALWPRLRLLSCWADANAAPYPRQLAALFPQARLQPKGLLATEGFVSFPLHGQPGHALSVQSHFYEFIPQENHRKGAEDTKLGMERKSLGSSHLCGENFETLLAHELAVGARYAVVISTGGGLLRYQLGDIVEVVGKINQCPLLRFVGRQRVVDWFGEKLNAAHVGGVVEEALHAHSVEAAFAMLACDPDLVPPTYALYIQSAAEPSRLYSLGHAIEKSLCQNPHYAYCRALGQLGELRLFAVEVGARQTYIDGCVSLGQRAGDVKPVWLHRDGGWSKRFVGQFLSR